MLPKYRLKIQFVRYVKVGRNSLGVAVNHNGFVAALARCQYTVYATVIKLNALPNAVGTAAQNNNLFLVCAYALILILKGRVVVRRFGLKLSGAGINQLVYAVNVK